MIGRVRSNTVSPQSSTHSLEQGSFIPSRRRALVCTLLHQALNCVMRMQVGMQYARTASIEISASAFNKISGSGLFLLPNARSVEAQADWVVIRRPCTAFGIMLCRSSTGSWDEDGGALCPEPEHSLRTSEGGV